jgi:hypothetical protein
MKAITICQPYASLIARGYKQYETRSWATRYRGPIAIHAGISDAYLRDYYVLEILPEGWTIETNPPFSDLMMAIDLPFGAIIATAELVECWNIEGKWAQDGIEHKPYANISLNGGAPFRTLREPEILFGDYSPGRYAWELSNVCALPKPLPCRGRQGLWTLPPEIATEIKREFLWAI